MADEIKTPDAPSAEYHTVGELMSKLLQKADAMSGQMRVIIEVLGRIEQAIESREA